MRRNSSDKTLQYLSAGPTVDEMISGSGAPGRSIYSRAKLVDVQIHHGLSGNAREAAMICGQRTTPHPTLRHRLLPFRRILLSIYP